MRRSKYVRWLEDPETFFIVAKDENGPIGYAFFTVGLGYASWTTGGRAGVLETVSVLSESRGSGVGAVLIWTDSKMCRHPRLIGEPSPRSSEI